MNQRFESVSKILPKSKFIKKKSYKVGKVSLKHRLNFGTPRTKTIEDLRNKTINFDQNAYLNPLLYSCLPFSIRFHCVVPTCEFSMRGVVLRSPPLTLLQSSAGTTGHNVPATIAHGTNAVTGSTHERWRRRLLLLKMRLVFLPQLNTVHGHVGEVYQDGRRDQVMIHVQIYVLLMVLVGQRRRWIADR